MLWFPVTKSKWWIKFSIHSYKCVWGVMSVGGYYKQQGFWNYPAILGNVVSKQDQLCCSRMS